jgi:hypothetical protein
MLINMLVLPKINRVRMSHDRGQVTAWRGYRMCTGPGARDTHRTLLLLLMTDTVSKQVYE